jgi:DNA-binding GntR family transcriptional regulator
MSEKPNKIKLSEQVKDYLLSRYARGEVAWNEEKLARRFRVSRTPIRDVLYELEKQRIIIRRNKRGIVLRKPSAREITEIYDVRVALEKLAIERAVNQVTPKDIQALKRIDRNLNRAIGKKDVSVTDRLEKKFHTKLIEISGNQYLQTMIDQFDLLIRSFQIAGRLHISTDLPQNPRHDRIIEALDQRDKRTCLNLICKHLNGAKKELLKRVSS